MTSAGIASSRVGGCLHGGMDFGDLRGPLPAWRWHCLVQVEPVSKGAEEARKKAEEQAQLAKRQVEAAEEQADAAKEQAAELSQQVAELREMRTLFQGPPLEMFLIGENRWHLANKRDERVVINADDFIRLRFDAPEHTLELAPYEAIEVVCVGALGKPIPATLILRVNSHPDPLHVRIPRA